MVGFVAEGVFVFVFVVEQFEVVMVVVVASVVEQAVVVVGAFDVVSVVVMVRVVVGVGQIVVSAHLVFVDLWHVFENPIF